MANTITATEKLISDIEEARFHTSEYDVMFEFCDFIERIFKEELESPNQFETIHDWIDSIWFAQRYGGDILGPVVITEVNHHASTQRTSQYKVTYGNCGLVNTREPWEKP